MRDNIDAEDFRAGVLAGAGAICARLAQAVEGRKTTLAILVEDGNTYQLVHEAQVTRGMARAQMIATNFRQGFVDMSAEMLLDNAWAQMDTESLDKLWEEPASPTEED